MEPKVAWPEWHLQTIACESPPGTIDTSRVCLLSLVDSDRQNAKKHQHEHYILQARRIRHDILNSLQEVQCILHVCLTCPGKMASRCKKT